MNYTNQVFDRIKEIKDLKTDAELSKEMKLSRQYLCNCRRRDSLPYGKIIKWCKDSGTSLDSVFIGE